LAALLLDNFDGVLVDESEEVRFLVGGLLVVEVDDGLAVPLDFAVGDGAFDGPGGVILDDNWLSSESTLVALDDPGSPEFAFVVELLVLGVLLVAVSDLNIKIGTSAAAAWCGDVVKVAIVGVKSVVHGLTCFSVIALFFALFKWDVFECNKVMSFNALFSLYDVWACRFCFLFGNKEIKSSRKPWILD
jgi:hypothetical protein